MHWIKAASLLLLLVQLSWSFQEDEADHRLLEVFTLTEDSLEGAYTDLERGIGIRFVSKPDSLYVTMSDGEPLLVAEDSQGSTLRLVNIGGRHFIQHMVGSGGTTSKDYAVPMSKAHLVRNPSPGLLNALVGRLENMDEDSHKLAFQEAVQGLLVRPEILLLEPAAFALGNEGITGLDYPSSLPFYLAALQVQKLMASGTSPEQPQDTRGLLTNYRMRRQACLSICPTPCPNDECLGMCGYGCNCWRFLCGDCCYHLGCYDHDLCCRDRFIQSTCLFPFGFQCNAHYRC